MAGPLLVLCWGAGMAFLARVVTGRWLSHLAMYSLVWTISLFTYELRLIAYNGVVFEAWVFVFVAWTSLYIGTALGRMMCARTGRPVPAVVDLRKLRFAIWGLALAGATSTVILSRNLVLELRSENLIQALTDSATRVYALRFEGDVSGLMYLNFLPYAGCVLAGIYTARLGRLTVTASLPIVVVIIEAIISMQRAGMVFGALLFAFSYAACPKGLTLRLPKWQKIAATFVVIASFLMVTAQREGGGEIFESETPALARVGELFTVAPVLYFYASSPLPCFSEYLKHPVEDGGTLAGRYMFASIYRLLAKLGYDTYVPYLQTFYYTPAPTNVGTYLRELHYDFGGTAIFLYPFALGFSITWLEARRSSFYSVVLLTFLYLVVAFSINFNFIGTGVWYFPLPIALSVVYLTTKPVRQRSSFANLPSRL